MSSSVSSFSNINPKITQLLTTFGYPVYHDNAPEDGAYPMIQYTTLSDRPALQADNRTVARETVIRVTLINNTPAGREDWKNSLIDLMENAGFMWQNTSTVRDRNEYYTAVDFSAGEEKL